MHRFPQVSHIVAVHARLVQGVRALGISTAPVDSPMPGDVAVEDVSGDLARVTTRGANGSQQGGVGGRADAEEGGAGQP